MELGYESKYFFDEMSFDELKLILENYQYRFKNEYEMNRLTNYIIAQSNSTKKMNLTDISTFVWDKQQQEKQVITTETVEMMKEKGNDLIQKLMKNNIQI